MIFSSVELGKDVGTDLLFARGNSFSNVSRTEELRGITCKESPAREISLPKDVSAVVGPKEKLAESADAVVVQKLLFRLFPAGELVLSKDWPWEPRTLFEIVI
jgi:hypothetical protein